MKAGPASPVLSLLAGFFVIYATAVGGLWAFQRQLLFLPDTNRPALPAVLARDFAEAEIATADGLKLLAWYRAARGPRQPTLLYLHGNGGHIGYRAGRLRQLADAGLGVLALEWRGYGGNPGQPSEEGLRLDAHAGYEFLRQAGMAEANIVVYGESLGAGVAILLAVENAVGALILESPYTSIADLAQHHYPWVPARWLVRDRFDAAAVASAIRVPVLVLHGEEDAVVPVTFGRRLFAVLETEKEAWFAPSGGHNDLFMHGALGIVVDFLQRRWRGAPGEGGRRGGSPA